jgi:SAM-dependent methyltransferase
VFTEPFPKFDEVVREFEAHECHRVLDLGCGNGGYVVQLAKLGFKTVGLDISSTGLGLTREWLNEEGLDADTIAADVRRSLPLRSGSFDGLLSTQVIHHARISEVRRAIAEIWRILAKGGVAFVTVAGQTHEDETYEEIEPNTYVPLEGMEKGLAHHIFTEEELGQEFQAFQIMEISRRAAGRVIAIWVMKL